MFEVLEVILVDLDSGDGAVLDERCEFGSQGVDLVWEVEVFEGVEGGHHDPSEQVAAVGRGGEAAHEAVGEDISVVAHAASERGGHGAVDGVQSAPLALAVRDCFDSGPHVFVSRADHLVGA